MKTELMLVTPAQAQEWLTWKNPNNRPLNERIAKTYARDMLAGKWTKSSQGIAFNTRGELTNGQHRLRAIVISNVSVMLNVTTDEPLDAVTNHDQNKSRSISDNLKIHGFGDWATASFVSVFRNCYHNISGGKFTQAETEVLIAPLAESIRFAADNLRPKDGLSVPAALKATVALAFYYGADKERLLDFCQMYRSGEINGSADNAVIKLRDKLASYKRMTGGSAQSAIFDLSQSALSKFLSQTSVTRLTISPEHQFPKLNPKPFLENKGEK